MRRPDFDDPDLPLSDLFARRPETAVAFLDRRMLCPGCPIAPFHTIADACVEYSLEEAAFREDVKSRIAASEPVSPVPRSARRGRADR
ncbi:MULTISPECIES: DUF1858 domain-containing protein [Roseobacteraceae]|uniref:Prismane_assoc: hybrid cluster protein-associated redox disulfide domain protein n=1 Tax=Pseudosulfitobacter pseudonitzschiae TaxID=1402135 RepID=A0A221K644_9RHOB|nr:MULTISPECIES: DUF1858 domain-containing protein [Roseobacteraceae]ASM74456.1 prismane_assoc: hybrid cluster protein-associated redox disulfide domain protein [Pseudosulfitobacter pseudonitzschiae]